MFIAKSIQKMKLKNILYLCIVLITMNACKDFDELEKDPNRPTSIQPSLLFNGALTKMYDGAWNDVMRWNQFYVSNFNYYANNEYKWTRTELDYLTLTSLIQMEKEAITRGAVELNPYSAMSKFLRAYFLTKMTLRVGDIPVDEALLGRENIRPKYNSQKEVYLKVLQLLDEANDDLAKLIAADDHTLSGDIYLNNDLKAWQKVVNAFTLRVLISLSKKESDGDLNIKQKFTDLINNPAKYPLMETHKDNMQYTYNTQFNKYPRNKDNFGFNALRENLAATYLEILTEINDPRLYVVAEPAMAKLYEYDLVQKDFKKDADGELIETGVSPSDPSAFVGPPSDEDLSDIATKAQNGDYSFQNRQRYYDGYTAESTVQIGYPEMCFNIAEAINRGWVSGKTDVDAEEFYKKGIMASMEFYGITTGTLYTSYLKPGEVLGNYEAYSVDVDLDDYYGNVEVKYAGNNETGLNQIAKQRYLAFFMNSGWEAFHNQRRIGVPAFYKSGPGNGNGGRIPKRWQYPANEGQYNAENYNSAIQSQFGGQDNINMELWLNLN